MYPSCRCPGLSPRVRGNRRTGPRRTRPPGSIPACAGEPRPPGAGWTPARVYPRVCGGTQGQGHGARGGVGLSPRVRGNRNRRAALVSGPGSIPACAGEPSIPGGGIGGPAVYPRVCGGTTLSVPSRLPGGGLSPRVRGNRPGGAGGGVLRRSIPACAGEPRAADDRIGGIGVYPRVCGGTAAIGHYCPSGRGLSPRVRGNPSATASAPYPVGSIPACAGEPSIGRGINAAAEVYPRVCGGTPVCRTPGRAGWGLSPRVRGNQPPLKIPCAWSWSIPACAGEPTYLTYFATGARVYPRVCGGTPPQVSPKTALSGLSPRVRGNPQLARHIGAL